MFESLPFSIEVLEGITAMIAVVMLFYVSFWLVARMEHKRWMEFVRARLWSAVSIGSTVLADHGRLHCGVPRGLRDGAVLPGAVVVRRRSRRAGCSPDLFAGLAALTAVALVMFRLGRRVPVQAVHEHRCRVRDDHIDRRSSATRSTPCRPAT